MQKNLLIASQSEQDVTGLTTVFKNLEEIRLLPSVESGTDTIDKILTQNVDVLLLDLVLSGTDGIDVLDFIARLNQTRRPMVILISAFSDDRLLSLVQDRVTYCFAKPLDYELVLLRVLQLINTQTHLTIKSNEQLGVLETQIAAGIRAIGIPAHLKGYYYLREAIRIYAQAPSPCLLSITGDVYPEVAKIFNTKATLVEHAIRNAIEIAWMRGNIETLHAYFGYTVNDNRGKPSNFEFIAMMAERARSYV